MFDLGSVGIRGGRGGRASGARPILILTLLQCFQIDNGQEKRRFCRTVSWEVS
jgi:hypothetical protein